MKRIVLLLAVVGTTLALATGMALAQATTDTYNETVPVDVIFDNPCNGEPLHITGEIHILYIVTEDANGGIHIQMQIQPQEYTATGLVSGEQYRGVGVSRDEGYIAPGTVRELTHVNHFSMISEGPTANFLQGVTIHHTFNAKGEPTADILSLNFYCVG